MRRHFVVMALIAIITLTACLTANAQGVRFITPQDGDVVRDVVQIQATKPRADEGWISYKIERGGQGDFVAAVVSPFIYVWDTRARDDEGKQLFRDGQYTITAVAMSPSGRKVGEASITVTLKNALSASEAPRRVPLLLWYDRNDEVRYRAEARWTIRPAENEENPEDVYEIAKNYDGMLIATWKNRVMSPSIAAGHAVLHVVVGSSGAQAGTAAPKALDRAGKVHTYIALRNGEMRLKHNDETPFELAEMTVPLGREMVSVGDTWRGPITIWPDPLRGTVSTGAGMGGEMGMMPGMDMGMAMPMEPGMDMGMAPPGGGLEGEMGGGAAAETEPPTKLETRTVMATHKVEGFEWVMGHPTVRIRSTYQVDDDKITVPTGGGGALGGDVFGGMPGEEMMGMPPEPMMGMPPEPMMGEAMPGQFGDMGPAMGGGGPSGIEHDTSYTGERLTWWAYDLNRPIRIVDTITHTFEIERQAQMGGEMGMGMEMMGGMPPGAEMMPPEMIEPGLGAFPPGAEPGMIPPEAMPPGAMPGMPGQFGAVGTGMAQMEPPEPMKVKVRISLVIQEVDL